MNKPPMNDQHDDSDEDYSEDDDDDYEFPDENESDQEDNEVEEDEERFNHHQNETTTNIKETESTEKFGPQPEWRCNVGNKWTEEHDRWLLIATEQKIPISHIAKTLKRSHTGIRARQNILQTSRHWQVHDQTRTRVLM